VQTPYVVDPESKSKYFSVVQKVFISENNTQLPYEFELLVFAKTWLADEEQLAQ